MLLVTTCTTATMEKVMSNYTDKSTVQFDLDEYDYVITRDYFGDNRRQMVLTKKKTKPLKGKRVIFTGVLSGYERARAIELAINMGATVVDSVKNTPVIDMVILGLNPGIKNQKLTYSLKTGAELVTDKQFSDMVAKYQRD